MKDDKGREWPIVHHIQPSARGPIADNPDLCLHTTETSGYVTTLEFPSNFQCGGGVIGQHIKLGLSGDAVFTEDDVLMQIEMVGRSQLARWLPQESTLGPTVALVAWLHRTGRIRTGLKRPNPNWPVVLDRGPQASVDYYRRKDGTWRDAGVYGHVEIPTNDHWDPGSFDYPKFFTRVQNAIEVQKGTNTQTVRAYKVGTRVYNSLKRALHRVRSLVAKGKAGASATVRVVFRKKG